MSETWAAWRARSPLAYVRKRHGHSRKECAQTLSVSCRCVAQIETGAYPRNLSPNAPQRIEDYAKDAGMGDFWMIWGAWRFAEPVARR